MKDIKISIITSVYNNIENIECCIQSVLSQDYENIEYIIIDGGSNDGTVKIIEKYKSKIKYFISEPDDGIYHALNKGIKIATGNLIGILHSDDIFYKNDVISVIANCYNENKPDLIYGDLLYVQKDNTDQVVRFWHSGFFNRKKLFFGWMPPHPTVFLKKKIYHQNDFYNNCLKISADYDFLLKILVNKKYLVHYLSIIITKMRLGGKSNKNLKNLLQKSKEDYSIVKKNKIGNIFTVVFKILRKVPQFLHKNKKY